ncbi:MAG: hypothetical protein IIV89_00270 [Bacteroidaceae bacterium]|nr:hypothetical protein [Bacteroidaceae bacterium]
MKKKLALYLVSAILLLATHSCGVDEKENAVLSPYAVLHSFKIGNIRSEYPSFTSAGEDTLVAKTIAGSSFPFTINQMSGEVFNVDSLPYATNLDKLVIKTSLSGYAKLYVDSLDSYEFFSETDSLDFSYPRKMRVTSADGNYVRDYTVTVNVHRVDPNLMVWNDYEAPEVSSPSRAVEFNGAMCIFGNSGGQLSVAMSSLAGEPEWSVQPLDRLPSAVNLSTVHSFNGSLFVVAGDGLYRSADAVNWEPAYAADGLLAIVAASDESGEMLVATADKLLSTIDGVSFTAVGDVPAGFPLYDVSIASYTLSHNSNFVRYMLVGYTTAAMDKAPVVWSKLSTEKGWSKFDNEGNPFPCPALEGLSVVRYDNFLYAMGGDFKSFYISRDNGITWKEPEDFYQRLPKALIGMKQPFVVTVDSNNVMWMVTAGSKPAVWKGILNRLGFAK